MVKSLEIAMVIGMINGIPMGCLPYKHPVPYFWPYFARDIPLHRPEK
jgi:hypothetical protein